MDSDQAKIFVGGISWETSEDKLRDYFSNYGSVVEAVIVKDRATGRARGFGFVAFSDADTVDRVILEKHSIDGRMVETKRAVPRDEQQNLPRSHNAISVSGNIGRTTKIFVGGLASTVTEEDFKKYFSQFGEIMDVVVMYDPNTKRPRGFGFITFDSEDAVEKVLQQNTFHEIHDKLVEVKKAVPRELSAGRTGGSGGFGGGRGGSIHAAGYGQTSYTGSGNAFSGHRYVTPAGRGGYQSYGPPPYGTPGYAGPGYNVAMNGSYAAPAYGGGSGYGPVGPYGGGYGNPSPSTAYAGAGGYGAPVSPMGGFVSGPPAGSRSPWGGSGGNFGSGGSPAAYGTGSGMSGYPPASGWNAGGAAPQSNGGAMPYSSNGYGYGNNESPSAGGYPGRGMSAGAAGGYGDPYSSSWKSGDTHNSAATAPGSGVGSGYSSGAGAISGGDGTGYGIAGRQTQRGPDNRFRPYPAATERTA